VRTNRLFALSVMTVLVGLVPWLTGVSLVLKLFGLVLILVGLLVAYLTGAVLLTQRRKNGCSNACDTCSCSSGSGTNTSSSTPAAV
jgi:hypothetical protein